MGARQLDPAITATQAIRRQTVLLLMGLRKRYRVEGASMEPLLHAGDTVIARPPHRGPAVAVGDIIIAHHPERPQLILIKSVVAVDSKTGRLTIQGTNQSASTDSRSFGAIPLSAVTGIVTAHIPN